MDEKTLLAYKKGALAYSDDWNLQPTPSLMYELIQKFFIPGGSTADVGCGNGRDAAWMSSQGYKVSGFDSSKELLEIASSLYPSFNFKMTSLPGIKF